MIGSESRTILIVEDEAAFRHVYQDVFDVAGYIVLVADDGEQGWDMVKSEKPDLVLLDLLLPGMHGFEVLSNIRGDASTNDIPVIVLTALGEEDDIRKGIELGATDYMVKGFFTPREILTKARAIFSNNVPQ